MKKLICKYVSLGMCFVFVILSLTACGKPQQVWKPIESDKSSSTTLQESNSTSDAADESTTETATEATTETTTEESTKESTTKSNEKITKKSETTTSTENLSALEKAVRNAAEKYGAVGIQAAVISNGKVSSTEEYGWAVINQRKMTEDTKIRVASLSKTAVAMVVFKLIEEGKLDLSTDISEYIGVQVRNPAYPDAIITLEMLLTHTSGLVDASYVKSLEELQNHFLSASAYTKYKPGEMYTYNNFAFGVIGSICEIVGGKSVSSLAKEYFFNPMGIVASFAPSQINSSQMAVIYQSNDSVGISISAQQGIVTFTDVPARSMRVYAGGLTISAVDYAKLLTLFMNNGYYNGRQLLSEESIKQMQTVQLTIPGRQAGQCMPMVKLNGLYGESPLYYHTGSAYGVYALYTYNPETKMGVVVVTTGASGKKDSSGIYAVCSDIARAVYTNKNEYV